MLFSLTGAVLMKALTATETETCTLADGWMGIDDGKIEGSGTRADAMMGPMVILTGSCTRPESMKALIATSIKYCTFADAMMTWMATWTGTCTRAYGRLGLMAKSTGAIRERMPPCRTMPYACGRDDGIDGNFDGKPYASGW